jgi:putative flippase GtrA
MPEQLASWGEGWLWLGGSLLVTILWTNLAWYFRQPRTGRIGEFVARLIAWRFSPLLFQALRLLYYIGLPGIALLWRHAIVQRYLGLSSGLSDVWLRWVYDTGWAAALGIGAGALLAVGWWAYRRALHAAGRKSPVAGANVSGWILLREAAYHEVHWAFYRSVPIFTLAQANLARNEYWGVWIGLSLAALEAALNPAWRKALADLERAPARLVHGALAVVSSVMFIQTQDGNLLLSLLLHFCVLWGLAMLTRVFPLLPTHKHDQAPAQTQPST